MSTNSSIPPTPKSTLLLISSPSSSLEATLLKSSSESMGVSDVRVCGVAGNAASICATLCGWEVLLVFRLGCCDSGDKSRRVSLLVTVGVGTDAELSSLRLRVTGGSLETAMAAPSYDEDSRAVERNISHGNTVMLQRQMLATQRRVSALPR